MKQSNRLGKRIATTILAAALVAGLTAPAMATSTEPVDVLSVFTDIPADHWSRKSGSLAYCVEQGYMRGTSSDTFNPGGTVTVNQLAAVMVRMSVPEDTQASLAEQARTEWIAGQQATQADQGAELQDVETLGARYDNKDGVHWAYEPMYTARQAGLLEGTTATQAGEEPCTRSTMARMLVNALNIRGEDISQTNIQAAVDAMSDRYTIWSSGSAQEIGTAIALGLITGDNNKAFNPSGTMDRASMCEVLYRLDNPSGQRAAAIKQTGLDGSSSSSSASGPNGNANQTASTPITIDMRTPDVAHRAPKEGDTIIRPDGSEVVLARDPVTGVLGFGQNVGAYLGTQSVSNGALVKENTFGSGVGGGWDDILARGTYLSCSLPGYEYTYLWQYEWAAVSDATSPNKAGIKGTDGQVTEDGLWKYFSQADAGNGRWIWQGPSF